MRILSAPEEGKEDATFGRIHRHLLSGSSDVLTLNLPDRSGIPWVAQLRNAFPDMEFLLSGGVKPENFQELLGPAGRRQGIAAVNLSVGGTPEQVREAAKVIAEAVRQSAGLEEKTGEKFKLPEIGVLETKIGIILNGKVTKAKVISSKRRTSRPSVLVTTTPKTSSGGIAASSEEISEIWTRVEANIYGGNYWSEYGHPNTDWAAAVRLHEMAVLAAGIGKDQMIGSPAQFLANFEPLFAAGLEESSLPEVKKAVADEATGFVAVEGVVAVVPKGVEHVYAVTVGVPQTKAVLELNRFKPSQIVAVARGLNEVRVLQELGIPQEQIVQGGTDPERIAQATGIAIRLAQQTLEIIDGVKVQVLDLTDRTESRLLTQLMALLPPAWQKRQALTPEDAEQILRIYQLGV